MPFDLDQAIAILKRTPEVIGQQLSELGPEWTRNNEGPETWSPYDVLGHLIHGEKTDWIPRAEIILGDGNKTFVPFDRFAQFQNDQQRPLAELIEEFAVLREQSLGTLRSWDLGEKEFGLKGIHPEFGEVSLAQLLAAWVVHDLGHLAQISRVMAKQYSEDVGPWKAYMRILS